ncbi:MAG: hypothetical protein JZU65_05290, partial [Chlorobium sp.]|nr:hypothetical protein [Chlorobium sp.]
CEILNDSSLDSDSLKDEISEEIYQLLNGVVKEGSCLVLSSENISSLNENKLCILIDVLRSMLSVDGRLTMVYAVRNLFEHAVSWWAHMVRRHGVVLDRTSYLLNKYKNMQLLFVQRAMNILPPEEIKIVNYDKHSDLWKVILKTVDAPIENFDCISEKYNRSLPLSALTLMQRLVSTMPEGLWDVGKYGERAINSTFTCLGDLLGNMTCDASQTEKLHKFTEEELAAIENSFKLNFEEQVQWLNAKFEIEGGALQLFPWTVRTKNKWIETDTPKDSSCAELEHALFVLKEIFHDFDKDKWFSFEDSNRIEKSSIIRNSGIFHDEFYADEVMKRYHGEVKLNSDVVISHFIKKGILDGVNPSAFFDVNWYLSSNDDLKDVDPVLHYIQHGAAEGRSPHPKIPLEIALRYRYRGNLVSLLNLYKRISNAGLSEEIPSDLFRVLSIFDV